MGKFDLQGEDLALAQSMLQESFELYGTEAVHTPVVDYINDHNQDRKFRYGLPEEIYILFEQRPKPVLVKRQWFVEGETDVSILYAIPKDYSKRPSEIKEGALIRVKAKLDAGEEYRTYFVGKVGADDLNQVMTVCKVTPYKENFAINPEEGVPVENVDVTGNTFFRKEVNHDIDPNTGK